MQADGERWKTKTQPRYPERRNKDQKSGTVIMSTVSTNAGFLASIVISNRFSKQ
jgi:hypothetical protein